METDTPTAAFQQYLFKTSYHEDLSQPSLLPIIFANSAVDIFSPFLLGSDKSPSFQYISHPLQK